MLDPVLLAQLQRLATQLGRQLVHDPLDGERGLRPAGATVGVGGGLGGEHVRAGEPVRRELVDRVEHERAEDRDARRHQAQVGTHVGEQVHVQREDGAVPLGRDRDVLDLVAAVVGREQRLRAGLGPLDRLAQLHRRGEDEDLLGGDLQLPAEPAADVRRDDAQLVLGHAGGGGRQGLEDVRDLGRRPHGQLLAGGIDDHGARLHERRDEPLLAEPAADHDRVGVVLGRCDRLLRAATGAGVAGVEHPVRAGVGAEVRVQQCGALGERLLHVQDRRQVVVVDDDELGRVAGGRGVAGDHHGDAVTGEVHGVDGQRRRLRGLLVRRDRPGVRQARLGEPEVGGGVDRDDAGKRAGLVGVDPGDAGMRRGRAHHGQVQHPGQGDVVGPAGAPGDEAGVLLAGPGLPELRGGGLSGGRHLLSSLPPARGSPWARPRPASSPARHSARPARCSGSRCTGRGCPRCPRGPRARPGRGCRRAGRLPA